MGFVVFKRSRGESVLPFGGSQRKTLSCEVAQNLRARDRRFLSTCPVTRVPFAPVLRAGGATNRREAYAPMESDCATHLVCS